MKIRHLDGKQAFKKLLKLQIILGATRFFCMVLSKSTKTFFNQHDQTQLDRKVQIYKKFTSNRKLGLIKIFDLILKLDPEKVSFKFKWFNVMKKFSLLPKLFWVNIQKLSPIWSFHPSRKISLSFLHLQFMLPVCQSENSNFTVRPVWSRWNDVW